MLIDKKGKTGTIIDIAVPRTRNLKSKINDKIRAHTDLAEEMKRIYHLQKTAHATIIVFATGAVPKQLHSAIKMLGLKKNTYLELQKAALLGTSSIVRKFMNLPEFQIVV